MHKLGALLCTARVALVHSKELQQGKRAGKLQRDILFISMFTYSEKKKKRKPLLKIAAMLYMLTLHKNGNQRTFVVYSSN